MPSLQESGDSADNKTVEDNEGNDEMDELQHGSIKEEFKEAKEVSGIIKSLPTTFQDQVMRESTLERYILIIDQYQEQPHLLDPHLGEILDQLLVIVRDPNSHRELVHLVFKYMYYVTKTRGYKVIMRLMPHEVVDLEPILNLLQDQKPSDALTWETRYMLLLWLSIVCMIPFDMDRFNKKQGTGDEIVMMDRIIEAAKPYLGVFDKSRDAASYLIARFLTRPDVKKCRLGPFTDWSVSCLAKLNPNDMGEDVYWTYGLLGTYALLFKYGKREDLLDTACKLLTHSTGMNLMQWNTGLRKLHVKLIQRIGLTFLKPRLAAWRYQRGNRSLADNLGKGDSAQNFTSVSTQLKDEEDDEYEIPEELESIIEELLAGLRDKDTIVRWSAAKGIGRISGRLPRELADEVLASILDLFSDLSGDEPWHGGCLALAELGRRGLLLPDRLNDVVPLVVKALKYDEKRGNFSIGAHVRDAACYVCWSFARAYDPREFQPFVQEVASALLICSILDRDVNVRRAAAAAFQENVGRQGQFPHGIDIITTCDYFAVGSRRRCYTELINFIGQYDEYIIRLIDHLVEIKLMHWDQRIRELSAAALESLCHRATDYFSKTVLPKLIFKTLSYDLSNRHGATIGVGHIIHGLYLVASTAGGETSAYLDDGVMDAVKTLVQKQTDGNLYKGLSGVSMRVAAASFIDNCSKSRLALPESVVQSWREFLEDCLYQTSIIVHSGAVAAYHNFLKQYFSSATFSPFVDKYLRELSSAVETNRQGFALSIGQWPRFILEGAFKAVCGALIQSITSDQLPKKHAEARRDSVIALAQICSTVGVKAGGSPHECVCEANVNDLYETLFMAGRDYTIDNARGDIGSLVREASMDALADITVLIVDTEPKLISPVISETLFCQLFQQGNEKISRTRGYAGENFMKLLHHEPIIPHVPDIDYLRSIFPVPERKSKMVLWESSAAVSPLFAKLLSHPVYVKPILLGFVITIGGLTEHLLLHARNAVFSYLKANERNKTAMDLFTNTFLNILTEYSKDNRVTIPALKMLDTLLDNECFSSYSDSEEFWMNLLNIVRKEMTQAGDPVKLLAAIDVYCGMIQFGGEVRKKTLFSLMLLLGHKYPRIRKQSANKLYETLLMFDDICEEMDEVMVILSETLWDEDLDQVRSIRNRLCDLMGISKPVLKAGNPAS